MPDAQPERSPAGGHRTRWNFVIIYSGILAVSAFLLPWSRLKGTVGSPPDEWPVSEPMSGLEASQESGGILHVLLFATLIIIVVTAVLGFDRRNRAGDITLAVTALAAIVNFLAIIPKYLGTDGREALISYDLFGLEQDRPGGYSLQQNFEFGIWVTGLLLLVIAVAVFARTGQGTNSGQAKAVS